MINKIILIGLGMLLGAPLLASALSVYTTLQGGTNNSHFSGSTFITADPAGTTLVSSSSPSAVSFFATSTSVASIFPFASTTGLTISGTGSTTNFIVSSAGGTAGCATFSTNGTISNTGVACGTGAGGGSFPFTPTALGNSTSTLLQFKAAFISTGSSTVNGNLVVSTGTNVTNAFSVTNSASSTVFNVDDTASQAAFGVGTSSPYANLSISANSGDTNQFLFAISSTTAANATTTLFAISNIGSTTMGNFGACSGSSALNTSAAGTITCGAVSGTGGSSYSFTPDTYAGVAVSATSTGLFDKAASGYGFIASSTFTTNASTTNITYSGYLGGLARIASSTYWSLQDLMNLTASPGVTSGGTLATSTNAASQAAVTGLIRATDSNVAQLNFFNSSASSSVGLGANTTRYLGIEYNSGVPRATTTAQRLDYDLDTNFPTGTCVNDGSKVYCINNPWQTGDPIGNIIERFDSQGIVTKDNRPEYGAIAIGTAGTRNITFSAGQLLTRLNEITFSAFDSSAGGKFDRYYRDGASGWTKETDQTQFSNASYDDNTGTLHAVTALAYTPQWFYVCADSQSGGTVVSLYGQADYTTLAAALNATPPATVPGRVSEMCVLAGRIIAQQASNSSQQTISYFTAPTPSGSAVSSHADLSNLAWTSSGHTGTANNLAGFSNTGAAAYYTLSSIFPFTPNATGNYNQLSNGTTTQIHFGASNVAFSASSTAYFENIKVSTTTATSTFAGGWVDFSAINVSTTTATSTFANGIQILGGNLTLKNLTSCDTIDTDANGNLKCGTDSTGAGGSYPFTPGTYGATADSATSTLLLDTVGIVAQGTSTIGDGSQTGGLVVSGGATTTGNAYFGGKVGIGTTTPTTALAIENTPGGSAPVEVRIVNDSNSVGNDSLISFQNQGRSTQVGMQIFLQRQPYMGIINMPVGDPLELQSGTGKVGIGTAVPSSKLTVAGGADITGVVSGQGFISSTTAASIFTGSLGVGTTTSAQMGVAGTSTTGALILGDAKSGFAGKLLHLSLASSTIFSIDQLGSTTLSQLNSQLLKTNSSGIIIGAISGSDYVNGSGVSGNCVKWGANNALADQGSTCGTGAGGSYPFTPDSYLGAAMSATSTGIYAKPASGYGLVASSTFTTFASTSQLSANSSVWFTGLTGGAGGLAIDGAGKLFSGATTTFSGTLPISASHSNGVVTISIANALSDGSTKGAASFTAADFNDSSGNISLDYTNGQRASGSANGYLNSADFNVFNSKIGTSAALVTGQLLYATGASTTASVGTSTLSASSPLTGSFTQVGSGGSLGCQTASGSQAGCLASADWTTFNNKPAFAWTPNATGFFNIAANSTSTHIHFGGNNVSLSASSTANFEKIVVASSTATSSFQGGWTDFNAITVSTTTATSTFANGLQILGGNLTIKALTSCDTIDTDANGNLKCGTDSTSASGYPFTPTANFGVSNASATGTLMLLTAGLSASSTVRFGDTGVTGQFVWSSATGFLGLGGTTTPYAQLSIHAPAQSSAYFAIGSTTEVFSIKPSQGAFIGMATTTPWATISVVGDGTNPLFALATSTTSGSNNAVFEVDKNGHIITSGPKPTVTQCGTSPSVTGNDEAGKVTTGTANPLYCLVTFANAYSNAPACIVTGGAGGNGRINGGLFASSSTSGFSFAASSTSAYGTMTSWVVMYQCQGIQ